jgi:hypothetical protein
MPNGISNRQKAEELRHQKRLRAARAAPLAGKPSTNEAKAGVIEPAGAFLSDEAVVAGQAPGSGG